MLDLDTGSYRVEGLANDQLSGLGQRLDGLVLAKVLGLAIGSGVVGRNDVLKSKYRVSITYAGNKGLSLRYWVTHISRSVICAVVQVVQEQVGLLVTKVDLGEAVLD